MSRVSYLSSEKVQVTTNLRQQIAGLPPSARTRLELQLLKNRGCASKQNTILRRPSAVDYPLSFAQESLFVLYLLNPESAAYNQPKALRITGNLDLGIMTRVIEAIVARHQVLHSTFSLQDGIPIQRPSKNYSVKLSVIDLTGWPNRERIAEATRLMQQISQRPFNLSSDLMLRTTILLLSRSEHILLLVTPHIVSDAWSRDVLFREIAKLYDAFARDELFPLAELPIQYGDFAGWQRESLGEADLEEHLSYWRKQLEGVATALSLPTAFPRPAKQTFKGSSETVVISKAVTERLRRISRQASATLPITLLAAYQAFLWRYTGQSGFLVGMPISRRRLPELEGLVGLFVAPLLLRADISGTETFMELLGQVRERAVEAYGHPDIPFERLFKEFRPRRDLTIHPMFQVMFALRKDFTTPMEGGDLVLTPIEVDSGTAKFDLALTITERSEDLTGTFTYNADLFDSATIRRMAAEFCTLVEGIACEPSQPVAKLPLLTEAERQQLLIEWNDTKRDYPQDKCIHQLFEEQVERTPEAIAVWFEGKQLSYRELNWKANRLALRLKSLGAGSGAVVGIYVERCLEMIVALLGVLKAGAAFVPLDPDGPPERLAFMLHDTQAPLLVSQQTLSGTLPQYRGKVVCLDSTPESPESEGSPGTEISSDSPAYVIYTSGSTGRPKAVEVSHRALVNFATCACESFALRSTDRILQFAPISFDTSIEEIFPCLIRGATLVLRTESMLESIASFLQLCDAWGITVLDLPTVYWHELMAQLGSDRLSLPSQVRVVIIGGSRAAPERLLQWQRTSGGRARLFNTYGPTEATVVSTICELPAAAPDYVDSSQVPIGRPISNVQTYILDKYLNPVPVGVSGELYIGGAGLARGYLNCPTLTEERFVHNPFSDRPGARMYRTGDLARYRPDGQIEFLGRIDEQVKIRGFRVELGEIEAILGQHPCVRNVAVVAREDDPENKGLVAYIVPAQDGIPTANELRSFLVPKLPGYMVPSYFVMVKALPLLSSGKVDREALKGLTGTPVGLEKAFVPPRDALELRLARIWEEVLGVRAVGLRDNFFDLGGHSLLSLRLFSKIERTFGKDLPLSTVYHAPTVEQLASVLRGGDGSAYWSSLVPIKPQGAKPPVFCVHANDGTVFLYQGLARYLGPERPLYGLQSRGLDGRSAPHYRVEDMACHYIEELRSVQPKGPYRLVGTCFGGHVAFEMARQLCAKGEVPILIILDSGFSGFSPSASDHSRSTPPHLLDRFICHWKRGQLAGALLRYGVAQLKDLRQNAYYLMRSSYEDCLQRVRKANDRARVEYKAREYPGQITLLRSAEFESRKDKDWHLRWSDLALGGFCCETISCGHVTMFREPEVRILAEKLSSCLEGTEPIATHSWV